MKKVLRVFALVILTLSLSVMLSACAKVEGTYVYEDEEDGYTITLTLNDGEFSGVVVAGSKTVKTMKGTYKVDGNKITVTPEGEDPIEGKINGGKSITINLGMSDEEVTLTRQK